MELLYWQGMAVTMCLVSMLLYGDAQHWRGKAMTLDKERNEDGWRDEAIFWRRHFNADAAEWTQEQS